MGKWIIAILLLSACDSSKPPFQIFPDMDDQRKIKPQSEFTFFEDKKSAREPVSGTIAKNSNPYPYKNNPELAGQKLKNPLIPSSDILNRGQFMYNVHCLPCHNSNGEGFGPVVKRGFAPPPPLTSPKVADWSDGRIFHVITQGQGIMPAYGYQVDPIDRWAIVLYIRALQRVNISPPKEIKGIHLHDTGEKS